MENNPTSNDDNTRAEVTSPPANSTVPHVQDAASAPAQPVPSETSQPVIPGQPTSGGPAPITNLAPHPPTNTGQIILQWLTYALWGWTVLIMSILTGMVMASLIGDADISSVAYPVAAVLVLMPAAFIADLFYSKQEPEQKTGAASIVMVIHAVLFALLGVGSLIVVVFCIVNLLTSGEDSSGVTATLYSFIIIAALYAITLLRTLAPKNMPWVKQYFRVVMVLIVGIVALAGILGPAAKERSTKSDRLIENNLYSISDAINQYASNQGKLPESASQLDLTGDSAKLFTDNLLVYKANTLPALKKPSSDNYSSSSVNSKAAVAQTRYDTTFYYQLCANFKHASKHSNYDTSYSSAYNKDSSGYTTYLSSSTSHPAGEYCYKISAVKLAY